ncbi:MAG: hypothetical protein NTY18_03850, partial [Deltaproteobacteria bacterium]|nr:hypothetical protein [Deltaproteobacteria bacterium]
MGVGLHRSRQDADAAGEDGAGLAVEDALEELAAGPVRHGVLHHRVVVDEAAAVGHVEAGDDRLGPLAGEAGQHVAARDGSAERAGVRRQAGVRTLVCNQAREVEGRGGLILDLVVVEPGALPQRDLGDTVGEGRLFAESHVGLDQGGLAAGIGHHEHARVAGRGALAGDRGENQFDHPALRSLSEMDEGAVAQEGGVERGQGAPVDRAGAGQTGLDESGRHRDGVLEARGVDAGLEPVSRGEIGAEAAVDEDQARAEGPSGAALDLVGRHRGSRVAALEGVGGQRRQRGEPPVLLAGGGQAVPLEGLAPGAARAGHELRRGRQALGAGQEALLGGVHGATGAGASKAPLFASTATQAKPIFSSSSASSRPP